MAMTVSVAKGANSRSFDVTVEFTQSQPWRVDWGDGTIDNMPSAAASSKSHVYTVIGPHEISVWADDQSHTENVFAGDYPVWDADSYKKTPVEVIANQRMNAAKIRATTGVLNG